MLSAVPQYIPIARPKIVESIQCDIRTLLHQNKTKEEVTAFYVETDAFNKLWNILKLTPNDLNIIIETEIEAKIKKEEGKK